MGLSACAEDIVKLYPACVNDTLLLFHEESLSTIVSPACTIEDAETTKIKTAWFQHPPEYKEELKKIFSFVHEEFSNNKQNLDRLEDVIFYNPFQQSCKETYDGVPVRLAMVQGFTNATNYLFLNDASNMINLERDEQIERKAYFGFVINGEHHIFVHELGHVELERYFLTAPKPRIDEITPQENPCYEKKEHYLVERYAHFVQMAFARAHPEEFTENNIFAENIFPYLEWLLVNDPEKLKDTFQDWKDFVDSWDEILAGSLDANEEYHDAQYAFFKNEAQVISPDFPYDLSYAVIAPFLHDLVEQQQQRANEMLDELEEIVS